MNIEVYDAESLRELVRLLECENTKWTRLGVKKIITQLAGGRVYR